MQLGFTYLMKLIASKLQGACQSMRVSPEKSRSDFLQCVVRDGSEELVTSGERSTVTICVHAGIQCSISATAS